MYVIDPEFDPDGQVPGWGVRGYYPVRPDGTIDQVSWVANPQYRPGPLTLEFPRPRNRLERALQLASAGHRPDEILLSALASAQVITPTSPEHPDQIPILAGKDGQDTVAMFTTAEHLAADTPTSRAPSRIWQRCCPRSPSCSTLAGCPRCTFRHSGRGRRGRTAHAARRGSQVHDERPRYR